MNVFLLPHQDDEYGVFSVLEQMVQQKQPVRVIYLTSGTPDGRASNHRNLESLSVLAHIGLMSSEIYFMGADLSLPDGQLHLHVPRAALHLQGMLGDGETPTRFFTPAWEGGHQDHDAAYLIACFLARHFGCVGRSRQFPLYQGQGLKGAMWHTCRPLPDNGPVSATPTSLRQRFRYLHFALRYPSQWRSWLGLWPMLAVYMLLDGTQKLQPLLPSRVNQEPHPGPCLYERRGFCSREEFAATTAQFRQQVFADIAPTTAPDNVVPLR